MKLTSNKQKNIHLSDLVLLGVLMLLLYLKGLIFYGRLYLGGYDPAFALATSGMLAAIWLIFVPFSPKAAHKALIVLYSILSFLMIINIVYYSYTSHLTSVVMLTAATQLGNVSDSVLGLVKPSYVLLIADLPIWLLYSINRNQLQKIFSKGPIGRINKWLSREIANPYAILSGAIVVVLIVTTLIVWPGFEASYLSNELLCYHSLDIAEALFPNRANPDSVDKSQYIAPDESSCEYFGLAKDRNLIVIQVEALQNFVIGASYEGQEITPTLNRLIQEDSIYFDHYYYQIGGGNTADAEYAVNNSLFAPELESAYSKYPDKHYHGLPYLLKDNGYSGAYAFHGYIGSFWNRETAYKYQGFDDFTSLEDLEETDLFAMGLSDKEFYRQSIPILQSYEEPFYSFFITLSSHFPYGIPLKDREITLKPEDEQTLFGLYLQAINYTDRAIGEFIERLKEAGLYENSMIVIYGDHYALPNTDPQICSQFLSLKGRSYSIVDRFNVPYIIHIPGSGRTETKSIAGGHMDSLPTMLCLLGIRNESAVMFGQNLLSAESGFVCEEMHLAIGSFISDELLFKKPQNNIKTMYDAYKVGTLERLDPMQYLNESKKAANRIADCNILVAADDILLTDTD